jgi:hypothetical protein
MDIDVKNIHIYIRDLLPISTEDGYFVEFENRPEAIFEVKYDNINPDEGTFRIKTNIDFEDLRQLSEGLKKATLDFSNSGVPLEEADDYVSLGSGAAFRMPANKKCWITTSRILIKLIKKNNSVGLNSIRLNQGKPDSETHKYKSSSIETIKNDTKDTSLLSANATKSNKTSSIILHCNHLLDNDNQEKVAHLPEVDMTDEISVSRSVNVENVIQNSHRQLNEGVEEESNKIYTDRFQYLISGREGETFFFEGSTTDKTGASFKIEYDSKTMKGEFSLIVDFNNLKAINAGFRRCVIKMVNNEASIKEASSFIMIEKGQAHYSEQDKVWMVDKPLVIKLLK